MTTETDTQLVFENSLYRLLTTRFITTDGCFHIFLISKCPEREDAVAKLFKQAKWVALGVRRVFEGIPGKNLLSQGVVFNSQLAIEALHLPEPCLDVPFQWLDRGNNCPLDQEEIEAIRQAMTGLF